MFVLQLEVLVVGLLPLYLSIYVQPHQSIQCTTVLLKLWLVSGFHRPFVHAFTLEYVKVIYRFFLAFVFVVGQC